MDSLTTFTDHREFEHAAAVLDALCRERKHPHEAKGILYCSCGRRLSLTTPQKRYAYFFCLSRGKCRQPYIAADAIERQIEELYSMVRLPDELVAQIEHELEEEVAKREEHRARLAANLEKRLGRLEQERSKLMEAFYADAVPLDFLKREQERITAETALLEGELATLSERIAEAEELVRIGLRLVQDCHEAYSAATPEVRRLWNEAVFSKIVVRDWQIVSVEYREPFASLLSRSSVSVRSRRLHDFRGARLARRRWGELRASIAGQQGARDVRAVRNEPPSASPEPGSRVRFGWRRRGRSDDHAPQARGPAARTRKDRGL